MVEVTKFLAIVLFCFAIGDIIGVASKAKVSSVFVAFAIFLFGFLTHIFPADIIAKANLTEIGKWSSVFIVFNMGTSINLNLIKKEWKVVILSLFAMGVAFIACIAIIPFIGRQSAIVAIPVVNGGINATQIMTDGALAVGATSAAALGSFLFAIQKFVGAVPASYFGRQEAIKLVADFRANKANGINLLDELEKVESATKDGKVKKVTFFEKYKKYYTNYVCLGIMGVGAYISYFIAQFTPFLNYAIWALVLGCTLNCLGLVPTRTAVHGKAIGLLMMATFAKIIPAMATITWSELGPLGFKTFMVFAAVLLASFLFLYVLPSWKLVGSRNLAMGISMAQLLGFPATQLIVDEVALAMTETEEERNYVTIKLTPSFVVSGFVSVTSVSVIIAGVLVNFL